MTFNQMVQHLTNLVLAFMDYLDRALGRDRVAAIFLALQ
jgi:hypothetical protein